MDGVVVLLLLLLLAIVIGSFCGLVAAVRISGINTRLESAEKDLYRALSRIVALEDKIERGTEEAKPEATVARMAETVQKEARPEVAEMPPPIPVPRPESVLRPEPQPCQVPVGVEMTVAESSVRQSEELDLSSEDLHKMAEEALPLSPEDLQALADEALSVSPESPQVIAASVAPAMLSVEEHRQASGGDLPRLKMPSLQFEQALGAKWFVWIGVVLMVIAGGYFLKYAYDNAWIGPRGRLAIGTLFSAGALAMGHYCWRRGWRFLFQGMTGGGLAGLYGCVFFSMQVYHLASSGLAMTLATGVTLLAIALSVAHEAMSVAVLGLIGGFLSPILLSTGENHPYGLFTYVFILNLVALGTAYYRQWRVLDSLAFTATVLLYQGWFLKYFHAPDQPSQMIPALLYTSLFYLLFLLIPMIHSLVRRIPAKPEGLALLALNAIQSVYCYYQVLFVDYRQALGVVVLLQAMLVFGLYRVYSVRLRDDVRTMESLLVIGLALTVLAVPIQLKLYAVALTWAAQGVLFVYLGVRFNRVLLRVSGAGVLVLAVWRLLGELPLHTAPFVPIVNVPFCSWGAIIAALGVSAWLLARDKQWASSWALAGLLGVSAYAGGCFLLSLETERCFHLQVFDASNGAFETAMTALWAFIPALSALALLKWREKLIGVCVLIAYGVGALIFLVGLDKYLNGIGGFVCNVSFGARLLGVGALSLGAWIFGRDTTRWPSTRELVGTMGVLAYAAGCLLLSLEVKRCFDQEMFDAANGGFETAMIVLWSLIPALSVLAFWKWSEKLVGACALAAYGVGVIFFLVGLSKYMQGVGGPVVNVDLAARFLWVGVLSLGAWIFGRDTTRGPSSRELVGTMGVLAYAVGCLLLSLEVKRCFDHKMFDSSNGAFKTTLMALWTVIPALSAWVLLKWREKLVAGCVIVAYGVGGFFFLVGLGEYSNWSVFPVLNLCFGVRLLWVCALWWGGRVAWKLEEKTLRYVGKILGHVSLAILLAIELIRMGTKDAYLPERMAVSLISAVWALQALGLIVDGLLRRMRPVRILGFLLFAITLVKIFLIDMTELEKVYRIISFFATGALLVVAGYCYQRFGVVLLGEDQETEGQPGSDAVRLGGLEARKEPEKEEKS